jgi:arylsulfatase A-like enzyme
MDAVHQVGVERFMTRAEDQRPKGPEIGVNASGNAAGYTGSRFATSSTYNHYPTGWAVAFSTPYRMFKRYSQYAGGTADPMVIHWPKGFKARGEIRDQYRHCTDIVPTILECCGLMMPDVVDGVKQTPLSGVSMRYSFGAANAPTKKETQYYEMLSTRGIWHKGWKASTEHGPMINIGKFDVWEYEAASPVTSSPAVAKGKVVDATAGGQVLLRITANANS